MIMKNNSTIAKEFIEKGFSKSCPIINMHGHFGPFLGNYMPASPSEVMINIMNRCGMKLVICSSHQFISSDPDYGNLMIKKLIKKYPGRFLGYWGINPNYNHIIKRDLSNFDNLKGFAGFKFIPDYHRYPLTGKDYKPVLKFANERGLIILIHTFGGSIFDSPRMFGEIANKYSNIKFIMGHSGYGDWEYAISLGRELSNVYLDITSVYIAHDFSQLPYGTGMPIEVPSCLCVNGVIEFMVKIASSKKILFGDDIPWFTPYFALGSLLFADINDESKRDIMYKNAENLLDDFLKT
jgi:predicted TIM-barrel fold metal-dependent hydrolase